MNDDVIELLKKMNENIAALVRSMEQQQIINASVTQTLALHQKLIALAEVRIHS